MTDCEVKEYGNFTAVDDVKVNGKLTLGENTADNGGLRLAYDGIHRRREAQEHRRGFKAGWIHGDAAVLPGVRAGLVRRERGRRTPRMQVQTDPHSPRQFRINGVVQNMPEFGKAFGCKAGQPMMPVNACHVW